MGSVSQMSFSLGGDRIPLPCEGRSFQVTPSLAFRAALRFFLPGLSPLSVVVFLRVLSGEVERMDLSSPSRPSFFFKVLFGRPCSFSAKISLSPAEIAPLSRTIASCVFFPPGLGALYVVALWQHPVWVAPPLSSYQYCSLTSSPLSFRSLVVFPVERFPCGTLGLFWFIVSPLV